jgi:hypothetical protein
MIARLSLEVFYIITRKLVGAFYVDQKKKDLLPSTLPSEHEQWGQTNAERTTSFNITFHRTVFVVLVSQRNARYSPAVPGVDFADVSLSSFYSYAATSATQNFKDKLWWFSVGE